MKKLVSLLASVCMVFALMPAAAFAQELALADPAPAAAEQIAAEADIAAADVTAEDADVAATAEEETAEAVPAKKGAAKASLDTVTEDTVLETEEPDADEIVFEAQEGSWQLAADGVHWTYVQDGAILTGKWLIGGSYYYFDPALGETNGHLMTGWIKDAATNLRYYANETGTEPGAAGSKYGVLVTGKQTIRSSSSDKSYVYYFSPNTCQMKTGWVTIDGTKYYFNLSNGHMKAGGWLKLNNYKYYFNTNGKMKTGWLTLSGTKYYLDPENGRAVTGLKTINGSKYYFTDSGKMKTNSWVKSGSSKYYMGSNGKAYTGGKKKVGSSYYYFDSNGKMKTGVIKISGSLYYFYSSGKAVSGTGWFKGSDRKSRYALGGGKVATGTKKIGSNYYQFNSKTGVCEKNLGDATDRKMQSQSSSTSKLIYVSKSSHQVRIYSGKKGSWNKIYTFSCSVGKSSTPTSSGTYTVRTKTGHHNYKTGGQDAHWNNGLDLTGSGPSGVGFNGYVWSGVYPDGSIIDSTLGGNVTGGRVRVSESNSAWMYNNIGIGTKVIIQ